MTTDPQSNPGAAWAQRLQAATDQIAATLRQPEVAQRLRTSPNSEEWSAMQVLGHVVEIIPYWLSHCQTIAANTGEPLKFGRTLTDPERLAAVERGALADPEAILGLLHTEVQAAAQAFQRLTPAQLARKGVHVSRGEMTVADIIENFIVSHAEDHLAQVRAALHA